MIKQNNENNKHSSTAFGGIASNTRLIPPNTTPTTTNKYSLVTDSKELHNNTSKQKDLAVFHNHSDWLTLNFTGLPKHQFDELVKRLSRGLATVEKDKAFSQGEKAKSYQHTINSPIGFKGAYNSSKIEKGIDNRYELTISLSGQYFASMTIIEQQELYRDLHSKYSATCSRVDVAIDDYSFENIPLNEMIKAYREGNYFDFKNYHHETDESNPNNPTTTHYFGSKGSKKLVRIYKHKNESQRLETQFRGKYAQKAFETIATLERKNETDEEWSKVIYKTIGRIAIGAIDFRDKSKLKNKKKACKSKTKRLPFWEQFTNQIGEPILIRVPTAKTDMSNHQRSFNWLEKTASKTLAKAFHVLGENRFFDYLYRLIKVGESKFTPQDRKQIEYLQDNIEYLNFD